MLYVFPHGECVFGFCKSASRGNEHSGRPGYLSIRSWHNILVKPTCVCINCNHRSWSRRHLRLSRYMERIVLIFPGLKIKITSYVRTSSKANVHYISDFDHCFSILRDQSTYAYLVVWNICSFGGTFGLFDDDLLLTFQLLCL